MRRASIRHFVISYRMTRTISLPFRMRFFSDYIPWDTVASFRHFRGMRFRTRRPWRSPRLCKGSGDADAVLRRSEDLGEGRLQGFASHERPVPREWSRARLSSELAAWLIAECLVIRVIRVIRVIQDDGLAGATPGSRGPLPRPPSRRLAGWVPPRNSAPSVFSPWSSPISGAAALLRRRSIYRSKWYSNPDYSFYFIADSISYFFIYYSHRSFD